MITWQYSDGFRRTSTWVGHGHACVPSLLSPLPPPSPPHVSSLSQSAGFGFPASYLKLPLAVYLPYSHVYVSVLSSRITPPSPPAVSKSLIFMSVSPLLPCR